MADDYQITGPDLTLHDGVPAIIERDVVRHTRVPELFETGGGAYIGYADDWEDVLARAFPSDEARKAAAQAAIDRYGLLDNVDDTPSIWLLVTMTLED